jgi:hypothetical protein
MTSNLTLEVSVKELPFIQELVSIMQDQMALIRDMTATLGSHVDGFYHWTYSDEADAISKRIHELLNPTTPENPA